MLQLDMACTACTDNERKIMCCQSGRIQPDTPANPCDHVSDMTNAECFVSSIDTNHTSLTARDLFKYGDACRQAGRSSD